MPTFETPRLFLRPPREDDLESIYRLGNNPNVMRFINKGKTQTREEAKVDLARRIKSTDDQLGYWIVEEKATGAFVGWLALKDLDQTKHIEIGYRYMEEFWGKGYATEGSLRLLEYAFKDLQLEEVVAVALEENKASIRVMEKLGMRFMRHDHYYNTDVVFYGITKSEFLP